MVELSSSKPEFQAEAFFEPGSGVGIDDTNAIVAAIEAGSDGPKHLVTPVGGVARYPILCVLCGWSGRPTLARFCCATSAQHLFAAIDAKGRLTVKGVPWGEGVQGVDQALKLVETQEQENEGETIVKRLNTQISTHDVRWTCCAMSGGLLVAGTGGGGKTMLVVWNLKSADEACDEEIMNIQHCPSGIRCCAISVSDPPSPPPKGSESPAASSFIVAASGNGLYLCERVPKTVSAAVSGPNSEKAAKKEMWQWPLQGHNPANLLVAGRHKCHKGRHPNALVTCCAISGNLVAAGQANQLIVCDVTTRQVTHVLDHAGNVTCCAVSVSSVSDADHLVAAGDDAQELVVWDVKLKSQTIKPRQKFRHGAPLTCCAISDDPDCNQLVAGDAAGMLVVRGLRNGEVRYSFEHSVSITHCAISGISPNSNSSKKKLWTAVKSYTAGGGEFSIEVGDVLQVLSETDGWSQVVKVNTEWKKQGKVPSSCVNLSLIAATDDWGLTVRKGTMLTIKLPRLREPPRDRRCLEYPRVHEETHVVPLNAPPSTRRHSPTRRTSVPSTELFKKISETSSPDWRASSGNRFSTISLAASTSSLTAATSRYQKDVSDVQQDLITVLCEKVCDHPQLLHCRGEWFGNERQTTLLHVLANADEKFFPAASLEVVLNAVNNPGAETTGKTHHVPFVLVPCYDSSGNTPLDSALNVGNDNKAKLLATAYVESADGAAGWIGKRSLGGGNRANHISICRSTDAGRWPWPHVTIARWIARVATSNPARLTYLLDAAMRDKPSPHNFPTIARSRLPRFLPSADGEPLTCEKAKVLLAKRKEVSPIMDDTKSGQIVETEIGLLKWRLLLGDELDGTEPGWCNWKATRRNLRMWLRSTNGEILAHDVDVTEKVIGTFGLLTFGGSSLCSFDAIALSGSSEVFECDTMIWAVKFKWRTYGSFVHGLMMYVYLVGLVLFWLAQVAAIVDRFDIRVFVAGQVRPSYLPARGGAISQLADGTMVASTIPIGALLIAELLQMSLSPGSSLYRFIRDGWNLIELLTYGMMLAGARSFCTSVEREQDVTTAALCGMANVLATLNLLSFLRTGSRYGKNIRMLISIFEDIRPFLEVQLIFILGFTMAFAIMLPDQPRFQLPMALLTSYDMMLGAWDLEQFEGSHDDGDGWILTVIAVFMFVLYSLGVLVVAMK